MADTSVAEAFPAVPPPVLTAILDDFGLAPTCSVVDLLSLGEVTSEVLGGMADYLIDNASGRRLRYIAPGLGQNSQASLPLHVLSTRPANALRRNGISTWEELTHLRPIDLMMLPALGRKSVAEIVGLALRGAALKVAVGSRDAAAALSAAESWKSIVDYTERDVPTTVPPEPDRSASGVWSEGPLLSFETLARWAICIGNAKTIGEALELTASRVLPEDVEEHLDQLKRTPLEALSEKGPDVAVGQAFDFLWAQCSDVREQEIFRRRTLLNNSTLEDLGGEMSITRERVRQIQKVVEEKVSAALQRPEASEIRWRSAQLREDLGTAISRTSDAAREALNVATSSIPYETATSEALLLWLAGPYRLDKQTGWMLSEPECLRGEVGPQGALGPPPQASLLYEVASDEGIVDIAAARRRATAAGLVADAVDDWIASCPFRDIDGTLVLWLGNVADKAHTLLSVLRRPATADELR